MDELPTIETERLLLRPFRLDDARDVQRLAGERDIARTTLTIPHPYEDGMAEAWIGTQAGKFARREAAQFAVVLRETGELAGCVGLILRPEHDRAELGYWIGKPYWGRGLATEAARAVLRYGFEELGLQRIHAEYVRSNPASGRVLHKIGMRPEGCRPRHLKKWGAFEDVLLCGLLREEYESARHAPPG